MLKNLLGSLLLPPFNVLLLLGLAWYGRFSPRVLRWAKLGIVLLFLQSLTPVSSVLIHPLEAMGGAVLQTPGDAGAIVVLGGGLRLRAEEFEGKDTLQDRTLVRVRYAAKVARKTGLPLLVTGGKSPDSTHSEAEVMAAVLEQEFGVPVRWQEGRSADTAENARFSAEMLRAAGIQKVVLVTQAFHMPRARLLFEEAGLAVVPAPTGFKAKSHLEAYMWLDLLPKTSALQTSYYALHEWIGLAWAMLVRGFTKAA